MMFLDNALILLGEDDGNDALLFEWMLRRSGLTNRLVVTPTLKELWAYLEGNGAFSDRTAHPLPGVVFLDGHIPPYDATVDAGWLPVLLKKSKIPLVFLTGDTNPRLEERAQKLGAVGRILKPITQEHLQSLEQTLGKFSVQNLSAEVA